MNEELIAPECKTEKLKKVLGLDLNNEPIETSYS